MSYVCFYCKKRHNSVSEGKSCKITYDELRRRKSKPPLTRGSAPSINLPSSVKEALAREEIRHKTAKKELKRKRSLIDKLDKEVVSSKPFRTSRGHSLFISQSAGVRSDNRSLEPWRGHCSCGKWNNIAGDPSGLLMNWTLHVN